MGYELHITRKVNWPDEDGPSISADEWLALLDAGAELSRATDAGDDALAGAWKGQTLFWFADGEARCKNPDQPTIRKMVEMAERLRATVQGDDGEIYRSDGTSEQPAAAAPAQPGILARISAWFRHRHNVRELQKAAPSFRAGQRVTNPWKEFGTILSVDRNANCGLGRIHVRLDDGREQNLTYVASCLDIVE